MLLQSSHKLWGKVSQVSYRHQSKKKKKKLSCSCIGFRFILQLTVIPLEIETNPKIAYVLGALNLLLTIVDVIYITQSETTHEQDNFG